MKLFELKRDPGAEGFDTSHVWFHGSDKRIKKFRSFGYGGGELGPGIYLADKWTVANSWARIGGFVMSCYIRKGDLFDLANLFEPETVAELHRRHNLLIKKLYGENSTTDSPEEFVDRLQGIAKAWSSLNKSLGGLGYVGAYDHRSQIIGQVVVFKPEDVFPFKVEPGK